MVSEAELRILIRARNDAEVQLKKAQKQVQKLQKDLNGFLWL